MGVVRLHSRGKILDFFIFYFLPWGGSTTPDQSRGWLNHPSSFSFLFSNFLKFLIFKLIFKDFLFFILKHVSTLSRVDTWRTVNFWMKSLNKVQIWSFSKTEVPSVMQIETLVLKNKVSKTQGPEIYFTLIIIMMT
jgi:hypothetical protein